MTHLSLHYSCSLFNLITTLFKINSMYKEKDDLSSLNNLNVDQIDIYFECISSCDISDGQCISKCVEILKDHER